MRRITITSVAATMLLLAQGCSQKYDRKRPGPDSPRGQEVARMLSALREAGGDGLDETIRRDGAAALDDMRAGALRAALLELVEARSVELETLDRFGENVYRAGFRVASGRDERKTHLLLVVSDGELRWAGPN